MKTEIALSGLMKCEYCGAVFNGSFATPVYSDDPWKCPICMRGLTEKSFGYKTIRRKKKYFKKYFRWIGQNGEWVNNPPKSDFILKDWLVRVSPPKKRKNVLQILFKRPG